MPARNALACKAGGFFRNKVCKALGFNARPIIVLARIEPWLSFDQEILWPTLKGQLVDIAG